MNEWMNEEKLEKKEKKNKIEKSRKKREWSLLYLGESKRNDKHKICYWKIITIPIEFKVCQLSM